MRRPRRIRNIRIEQMVSENIIITNCSCSPDRNSLLVNLLEFGQKLRKVIISFKITLKFFKLFVVFKKNIIYFDQ